jgi:hypothetical protein
VGSSKLHSKAQKIADTKNSWYQSSLQDDTGTLETPPIMYMQWFFLHQQVLSKQRHEHHPKT